MLKITLLGGILAFFSLHSYAAPDQNAPRSQKRKFDATESESVPLKRQKTYPEYSSMEEPRPDIEELKLPVSLELYLTVSGYDAISDIPLQKIVAEAFKLEEVLRVSNPGEAKLLLNYANKLNKKVEKKTKEKSLECQTLIDLGNAGYGDDKRHYWRALKIARKDLKNKSLECQALIGLGTTRDGTQHYRDALKIAEKLGYNSLEYQALIGLGNAFNDKHMKVYQFKYYKSAYNIALTMGNRQLQSEALLKMGVASTLQNSIKFYAMALELAKEIGDARLQNKAQINCDLSNQVLDRRRQGAQSRGHGKRRGDRWSRF